MKNILSKVFCLSIVLYTFSGCTSFVEDANVDPDLLTDSDAKNLFQGVLIANQFFHNSENVRASMIWLNQANGENRQYVSLNNWNNSTASEFDNAWNIAYVNCITQAKLTQIKATEENNPKLAGAAKVIEAHCMGTVASLWGDVPYSQLDVSGNNLTPVFDSQAAVYASLQTLLDQAIVNLSTSSNASIPGDKDIYYAGSTSEWIKLAYSLKARYYLHVKNYQLAKANALLGIDSANGDFVAQFGDASYQNFNPYYSFLVYDRDDYMSGDSYAARLLDPSNSLYRGNSKTDESARFKFNYSTDENYFSPYELNFYCEFDWGVGVTNGKFGGDSPMPMVTYGEMLLIIAESDTRTSFASGLASYNNYRNLLNTGYSIGIDNEGYDGNNFEYLPYSSADFAVGGLENPGTLTDQNALLREIYQERYIYFIGSYEAFTDFGRTNNLAGIQLKTGFSNTPQRFLYPQVEINSNPNTPSPIPSITVKTPVHL